MILHSFMNIEKSCLHKHAARLRLFSFLKLLWVIFLLSPTDLYKAVRVPSQGNVQHMGYVRNQKYPQDLGRLTTCEHTLEAVIVFCSYKFRMLNF